MTEIINITTSIKDVLEKHGETINCAMSMLNDKNVELEAEVKKLRASEETLSKLHEIAFNDNERLQAENKRLNELLVGKCNNVTRLMKKVEQLEKYKYDSPNQIRSPLDM